MLETLNDQPNNWSSFSRTVTNTIVVIAGVNLIYLLFQQIRVGPSTGGSSGITLSETISASAAPIGGSSTAVLERFFTLLLVIFFFVIFPIFHRLNQRVKRHGQIQFKWFVLHQQLFTNIVVFFGSVTGFLIFLCVRYTVLSLLST